MDEREKAFDEASKLLASEKTAPRDVERLRLGVIQSLTAENSRNNISDMEMAKLAAAASCGNGTDNCEGDEEEDAEDPSTVYMHRLIATVAGFIRRMSALDMAVALLEARNDAASQIRIRDLIRSSLNDPLPHVRTHVVRQIVDCRKDRQDFVPLLREIAKTDPFILPADGPADDGGDGDKFYPVRFDARRVLRHIQNNEPCTP